MKTVVELDVSGGKTASISVPTSTTRVMVSLNTAAQAQGVYLAVYEQDLENNQRFLLISGTVLNLSPYVGSNQLFFKAVDAVGPEQFVYVGIA